MLKNKVDTMTEIPQTKLILKSNQLVKISGYIQCPMILSLILVATLATVEQRLVSI